MNKKKFNKNEKGFTLVEMLVSITLFSIVLVVILGSIITIIDVNRKSRSLTIVMNDVNFAMESFTRTIKTGVIDEGWLEDPDCQAGNCLYIIVENQDGDNIRYDFHEQDGEGTGRIERKVEDGEPISITSRQINITSASFTPFYGTNNKQPRVLIAIEGVVQTSPTISSEFMIQTTVSQRDLDDNYLINN